MHAQWDPLEADFVHYYHLDLAEVMASSPRKAMTLASQLPPESRFIRAWTGLEPWGWERELMAIMLELQHATLRVLMAGFGAKKHAVPKPWSLPRPYEEALKQQRRRARRKATIDDIESLVGPMLAGPGVSHG